MTADARGTRWLDRLEEAFMALALATMTALTFAQVVLRYAFGTGIVWSLEATSYLFGWLIVIGMAYGVRTRSHIAVDLMTRSLTPIRQRLVASIALTLCLAYCVLMGVGTTTYVAGLIRLGHFAQDIPVPRWLLVSILPAGFALLALRLIQVGRRYFTDDRPAPAPRIGR